jgi:chorismate-pyruvate lyase
MHRTLNDLTTVNAELRSLCDGFFDDLAWIDQCQIIEAKEVDPKARKLLVHANHMTATLSDHYGEPVSLDVCGYQENADVYRRKIVLTVEGGARVVEVGVVKLNLAFVADDIHREIVKRKTPLGEILDSRNVLTRVESKCLLRFRQDSPIAQMFQPAPVGDVFGRIGLIYCDDKPVMELLEVVNP